MQEGGKACTQSPSGGVMSVIPLPIWLLIMYRGLEQLDRLSSAVVSHALVLPSNES